MSDSRRHSTTTFNLVDVVATLLGRWRLIVVVTGVGIAVAIVLFVVVPGVGRTILAGPYEYVASTSLRLTGLPGQVTSRLDFQLPVETISLTSDRILVQETYAVITGGSAASSQVARDAERILREQLSRSYDSRTATVSVRFVANDPEFARRFLESHVARIRSAIRQRMIDSLNLSREQLAQTAGSIVIELTESMRQELGQDPVGVSESDYDEAMALVFGERSDQVIYYLRTAISDLVIERTLASDAVPWPPGVNVATAPLPLPNMVRTPSIAIALFGGIALLLGFLLAFILDYIAYVRSTPSEIDKIKRARER